VEAMNARIALLALPAHVQDIFPHIDPESIICVKRFRDRIHGTASQHKMLFEGGKVSEKCLFVDEKIFITLAILSFFLYFS
jgi:hypothetical protein